MRENWHEMVSKLIEKFLPLLVSVLWLIVSLIPLKSDLNLTARPMIGLICVYFWTMYRPDLFNLFSVFVLGLFSDVLSIAPFGIYLFMYLVMYLLVVKLIKYITEKNFEISWIGLSLLLFVVMFVGWFVLSVYYEQFLSLKSFVFSYLLSVALYPIVAGINAIVSNMFLQDESI